MREAFLDADDLPADCDVLQALDEPMQLLGEGYHVIALVEPSRRFVVKYAKHAKPVPPLAPSAPASRQEWEHDYGVRPDGSLHPAIWQHIRAFEAYGPLAVPSRVYIADGGLYSLSADERRAVERFRSIGIVRSLESDRRLRVNYADDFPHEKRAERLMVSIVVVQPWSHHSRPRLNDRCGLVMSRPPAIWKRVTVSSLSSCGAAACRTSTSPS